MEGANAVRCGGAHVVTALIYALASPASALGQFLPNDRFVPELRADLLAGPRPAAQLGAGAQLPLGVYARLNAVAALGLRLDHPGVSPVDGRVDLLARFLLDPYRQSRFGVSAGAGLSARAERGDRVRALLLVDLDVEGQRSGSGIVSAIHLGLGGGIRVGVALRRSEPQRR